MARLIIELILEGSYRGGLHLYVSLKKIFFDQKEVGYNYKILYIKILLRVECYYQICK